MNPRKIAILSLSLALAGCNHSAGGGGSSSPSDTVNSKITGSAQGALTGQTALFESSKTYSNNGSGASYMIQSSALVSKALAELTSASEPSDAKVLTQKKTKTFQDAMAAGTCKFDLSPNTGDHSNLGSYNGAQAMKLHISGPGCPVELSYDMTASLSGTHLNLQLQMKYNVIDDKLASQLEVRSGDLKVTISSDTPQYSASQTLPAGESKGSSSLDIRALDLQGQFHTVKGGNDFDDIFTATSDPSTVQFSYTGHEKLTYSNEATSASSELRYELSANGTQSEANGTSKMDIQNPVANFYVDGVSVTSKAYATERDKISNSLFGGPTSSSDSSTDSSLKLTPVPEKKTSQAWSCVAYDQQNSKVAYIGYGSTSAEAKASFIAKCEAGGSHCSEYPLCALEDKNAQAYHCSLKDTSTGKVYEGTGGSWGSGSYDTWLKCVGDDQSPQRDCGSSFEHSSCSFSN